MCSLVVHAPNVRHVRPSLSWTVLNYPGPPLWCKCVSWVVHAPNVRHVRPSPSWTVLNYPGPLWCKCVPWGTCTECETCETIPTILDCPQLSWPTFGVSGSWVHAPNVRHVRPSPTILDCPQLSWPHLWCKCVPWVHAPNVRHVRPSPTILDSFNYPGPPLV
jgi:hypothetical protein